MPPLPAVPGVLRAEIGQTIGSDTQALNRLYLTYSGGVANESFVTLVATGMNNHWAGDVEPSLGTFHTMNYVRVTDLSSDVAATFTDPTSATGTDAGDPLAADTAMRFKFLVQRRYRGGHGGFYLGGLVEDRLATPQTWSDATLLEFETDWGTFEGHIIGISDSGFTVTGFCIVSYYSGFTVVTSPTTGRARNVPTLRAVPRVDSVTATQVDTHVSSQRRRSLIRA